MKKLLSLLLTLVLLAALLPAAGAEGTRFTDVPEDDPNAEAVNWAVEAGITTGTGDGTTFSPEKTCTRAEVVTFLWRAKGQPEPALSRNPFRDVPEGSWYEKPVLWAVGVGITNGTDAERTLFTPDRKCSWSEIITFLWRANGSPEPIGVTALTEGWDDGLFYKKAAAWGEAAGLFVDLDDFTPQADCSRALTVRWLWLDAVKTVYDAEGLMSAIAPGREIHLAEGSYNLTEWARQVQAGKVPSNPYVTVRLAGDGYEVVVTNVRELALFGDENAVSEITAEPRYAHVLTFSGCDSITLKNLKMGHTPEKGSCEGGVLRFESCGSAELEAMNLYGCGTYGITADGVESLHMSMSVIHDCTYGFMSLWNVTNALFERDSFVLCNGYDMVEAHGSVLTFLNCNFNKNTWSDFFHFVYTDEASYVEFADCNFDKDAYDEIMTYPELGERIILADPIVMMPYTG